MGKATGRCPQRGVSMSDDQWDAIGEASRELGVSRGEVIRNLIALSWHHTMCDVEFDPRLPGDRSVFNQR